MDSLSFDLGTLTNLLLASSFIRFVVVFGLLRLGLGMRGTGFGIVTVVLSFALAYYSVDPRLLSERKPNAVVSLPSERLEMMKAVVEPSLLERIKTLMPSESGEHAEERAVVVAYLLHEVKTSFELGLLFLIPFVLVDLLVVNGCLILGIESSFVPVLALPIKLFLFITVDGWSIIIERVLRTVV